MEGLWTWANDDVHCENGKIKFPCDGIELSKEIYEATRIYNSINRAKIINFFNPDHFRHSIVRQHAFHIAFLDNLAVSLFRISHFPASIIPLMKDRNYLQISVESNNRKSCQALWVSF